MRRGSIVRMIAIGVVAGVLVSLVAVLIQWLPTSASEEMDRITFVYWFATVICIAIFALVAAVIVYSVRTLSRAARGRLGRPADPRAHRAGDRLDDHPCGSRHRDRDRERDRAGAERRSGHQPAPGQRVRAAIRLAVRVPAAREPPHRSARPAPRPRRRARHPGGGRDPFVLGAADGPEAGRGSRHPRPRS